MEDGQIRHIDEELERDHTGYVFAKQESGTLHNPYDQEVREFTSIEQGDIASLQRSLEENYTGEIGTLAGDPLRSMKTRGIGVLTLASRAAIRGGVLPETAYSLVDIYTQKIEACTDEASVMDLFHDAEYQYAHMVREIRAQAPREMQTEGMEKRAADLYLERCKTYIFARLHEKISVRDMAEAIGLNANYLSELFHSCEGITVTRYIQREKIRMAKNLLVYSRYTYGEIAAYLGYSSQSHLGRQFKRETGMTMHQYRLRFGRVPELENKY